MSSSISIRLAQLALPPQDRDLSRSQDSTSNMNDSHLESIQSLNQSMSILNCSFNVDSNYVSNNSIHQQQSQINYPR